MFYKEPGDNSNPLLLLSRVITETVLRRGFTCSIEFLRKTDEIQLLHCAFQDFNFDSTSRKLIANNTETFIS